MFLVNIVCNCNGKTKIQLNNWQNCVQNFAKKLSSCEPSPINANELMRLWYLSHRRPAKAQAILHMRAVSPGPSLYAHMKYGSR